MAQREPGAAAWPGSGAAPTKVPHPRHAPARRHAPLGRPCPPGRAVWRPRRRSRRTAASADRPSSFMARPSVCARRAGRSRLISPLAGARRQGELWFPGSGVAGASLDLGRAAVSLPPPPRRGRAVTPRWRNCREPATAPPFSGAGWGLGLAWPLILLASGSGSGGRRGEPAFPGRS